MFRALAVLRVVVLVNAVLLNVYRIDNFQRPGWGAVVVVAMMVWTPVAWWAYRTSAWRSWWLLAVDLAVALAVLVASPLVKGAGFHATVPGFWVMGAMMAWAIMAGWRGGLVAAAVLALADLLIRQDFSQANYGNVFLLLIGGPIVGYLAESLQRMAVQRDAAERVAAAERERSRLARAVHDGVLQVLALVERRTGEAGGDLADLGRMAGEQEIALRSLIRSQSQVTQMPSDGIAEPGGEQDLAAALQRLETLPAPRVSVAAPGAAVPMPSAVVEEVVAAVEQCLSNIRHHVAPDAVAWVLLDDLGDAVEVSVRDEGPGIPAGRLDQAAAEGRLGVSGSIRGRIADLGGTATLSTGDFGTEWELTIPREAP